MEASITVDCEMKIVSVSDSDMEGHGSDIYLQILNVTILAQPHQHALLNLNTVLILSPAIQSQALNHRCVQDEAFQAILKMSSMLSAFIIYCEKQFDISCSVRTAVIAATA